MMTRYDSEIEEQMRSFYRSLHENERRRYAALEAKKLGYGGVEYVSQVLGCDPKTIRAGREELDHLPDKPQARVRQRGGTPKLS